MGWWAYFILSMKFVLCSELVSFLFWYVSGYTTYGCSIVYCKPDSIRYLDVVSVASNTMKSTAHSLLHISFTVVIQQFPQLRTQHRGEHKMLELAPRLLRSNNAGIYHIVPDLRLMRMERRANMIQCRNVLDELTDLRRLGKVDLHDVRIWVLL